jgi:hypothetical protein
MTVRWAHSPFIIVLLTLFLSSQCISSLAQAGEHSQATIETVYNAWRNRESRIHSFEFSWREAISVSKGGFTQFTPRALKSQDRPQPTEDTTYDTRYRLVVDGGMVRAEGEKLLASPDGGGLQDSTWILKEGLMKSFRPKGLVSRYPQGVISNGRMYNQPLGSQVDPHLMPLIMLYRPFRYSGIIFDGFKSRYSILPAQQTVLGRKCTVIKDARDRAERPYNMLWLDNERDYIPLRFSRQIGDKQTIQIEYLGWVSVGSEWLPTNWRRTYMNPDGRTINNSGLAVVHTQHLNHPIDGNEFTLDFPVGTWVNDGLDPDNRQDYILRERGKTRRISELELSAGATYEQLLNGDPGRALAYRPADRTLWRRSLAAAGLLLGLSVAGWYLFRKRMSGRQNDE